MYPTLEEATDVQLARAAEAYLAVGRLIAKGLLSVDVGREKAEFYEWPFDPETWMPSDKPEVNFSRAHGYTSYLMNRRVVPDVITEQPVLLGKKLSPLE